jgi:hypothetical protein
MPVDGAEVSVALLLKWQVAMCLLIAVVAKTGIGFLPCVTFVQMAPLLVYNHFMQKQFWISWSVMAAYVPSGQSVNLTGAAVAACKSLDANYLQDLQTQILELVKNTLKEQASPVTIKGEPLIVACIPLDGKPPRLPSQSIWHKHTPQYGGKWARLPTRF